MVKVLVQRNPNHSHVSGRTNNWKPAKMWSGCKWELIKEPHRQDKVSANRGILLIKIIIKIWQPFIHYLVHQWHNNNNKVSFFLLTNHKNHDMKIFRHLTLMKNTNVPMLFKNCFTHCYIGNVIAIIFIRSCLKVVSLIFSLE